MRQPAQPAAHGRRIGDTNIWISEKSIPPSGNWTCLRIATELLVTLTEEPESVFIKAQPYVQTMLFDASGVAPAGRSLTAETPPSLVYRYLVFPTMVRPGQLRGGGYRATAAPDNGDLDGPLRLPRCPMIVHASDSPGQNVPNTAHGSIV